MNEHPPFRAHFSHAGHRYEVILDVGGPWDGMVHVLDAEMLPDPIACTDVVITGAHWNGSKITLGDAATNCDEQTALALASSIEAVLVGQQTSTPPTHG